MKILGIETSCDETAMAILEIADGLSTMANGQIKVLSNVVSSQMKLHAKYGGVVPSLAAREHVKNIERVFNLAQKEAGLYKGNPTPLKLRRALREIDLIAVTRGPGLGPSLLVGVAFARALAWKYDKPIIGVNHLEGHIYSNFLKKVGEISNFKFLISKNNIFPILNLIVSGGHTELVLMSTEGRSASGGEPQIKYKIIGETLDDAVGEAFDKVARLLGLGYPGGPAISKAAEKGDPHAYPLPSPMIKSKNYNFSYSGLKTAVLYLIRDLTQNLKIKTPNLKQKNDIAASFQKAALDVLIYKTIKATKEYGAKSLFLSGGVSANKELRKRLEYETKKIKINYSQPEMEYTGDNAAMIAAAGYFSAKGGFASSESYMKYPSPHKATKGKEKSQDLTWDKVEINANLGF